MKIRQSYPFYFGLILSFSTLFSKEIPVIFDREMSKEIIVEGTESPFSQKKISAYNFGDNPVYSLNLTTNNSEFWEKGELEECFSLFPSEALTYHFDESPPEFLVGDSTFLGTIEHTISLREREEDFLYTSAFPIFRIFNASAGEVTVEELGKTISSGEELFIEDPVHFSLNIKCKNLDGELSIYSFGAKAAFPLLAKGRNRLDLGTREIQTQIDMRFTFADDQTVTPFHSESRDFWNDCAKPFPVEEIRVDKRENGFYELSWKPSIDANVSYQIFGSNSQDFVPDIYFHKHLDQIKENEISDWEDNQNFICETKDSSLIIDDPLAYYRIVAVQEGRFSNPSPPVDIEDFEELLPKKFNQLTHPGHYNKSPYVSDEGWNAVQPYLIPENHPIKAELDRIFSASRVTKDRESIAAAGFELTETQGLHVVACKHKKLKGYVIKMYTDLNSLEEDWKKWVNRVEGAKLIREAIEKFGYKNIFKVAKKWIYPLPLDPSPPDEPIYHRKNFVLVVKDMKLLDHKENHKKYRQEADYKLLKKIFKITELLGLSDTPRANNLAWNKEGKLVFVDTESYHKWPVNYHPLVEFLSKYNRARWKEITADARKS